MKGFFSLYQPNPDYDANLRIDVLPVGDELCESDYDLGTAWVLIAAILWNLPLRFWANILTVITYINNCINKGVKLPISTTVDPTTYMGNLMPFINTPISKLQPISDEESVISPLKSDPISGHLTASQALLLIINTLWKTKLIFWGHIMTDIDNYVCACIKANKKLPITLNQEDFDNFS